MAAQRPHPWEIYLGLRGGKTIKRLPWLTTLSVDAPLVALAWQEAYAVLWGTPIGWHHRGLLFASVWLGYAADRWLDGWGPARQKSHRHDFYRVHRWGIFGFWCAVLGAAMALAFLCLQSFELWRGWCLAASVLVYTGYAQTQSRRPHYKTIKACGIAVLIQASACLFSTPWHFIQVLHVPLLAGPIPLFALNCLMIENWEQCARSGADPSPGTGLMMLSGAGVVLALLHFLPALAEGAEFVALSSLASLMLLWGLHAKRDRVDLGPRRTLADFCLLTPFIAILAA